LQAQVKEMNVTKLRREVKMIENRIMQAADNVRKKRLALKLAHKENPKDMDAKKLLFKEIKKAQTLCKRLNHLHDICTNLLDHADETSMMASTSVVLQEFVAAHEHIIKDVSLEALVSQYQDMADNVDEMRENMGIIGESVKPLSTEDDSVDSLELELENFLAEDIEEPIQPQFQGSTSTDAPSLQLVEMPSVPKGVRLPRPVKDYFLDLENSDSKLEAVID
jgi:hypothetical protein